MEEIFEASLSAALEMTSDDTWLNLCTRNFTTFYKMEKMSNFKKRKLEIIISGDKKRKSKTDKKYAN